MSADLITYLQHASPWLVGSLVLPRVLKEIRRLIHARTFQRLGEAVVKEANWADPKTLDGILRLMRDIDRNAASGPNDQLEGPSDPGQPPER
ncbi:MAG TPA: hypothetical protein VGP57_21990 [Actinoplanes sp.]|nr:hypothetical protein [Actinoplanes sp.]